MEKSNKKLVTRCAICRTIDLDGTIVLKGNYPQFDGLVFQETILSRECGKRYYGEDFANTLTFIKKTCRH